MSIESVMPSNLFTLCHPLLLLPSIFPSIRVFSNKSVLCIQWPNYWSFSFSISPSNEYSGLISFRIDWLDLLEVQGTLKSLLQHHSSKASILRYSAFFMVQLTSIHDYWNNHSFDWTDLFAKGCLCFLIWYIASVIFINSWVLRLPVKKGYVGGMIISPPYFPISTASIEELGEW